MSHKHDRTISVEELARVEGEGSLHVAVVDGKVEEVRLEIYEPPRFFEALLVGRDYREPPDITARICGICPIAYQFSAIQALEGICGVEVEPAISDLRRLLYCAEWIESHALHITFLHAPDLLGYDGAVEMTPDHGADVKRALRLRSAGNAILELVGGRAVHPINIRVGGFYRVPTRRELLALRDQLEAAVEDADKTVRWVAGFDFPDLETDVDFFALTTPDRYPIESGELATTSGIVAPVSAFDELVVEHQVPHANALHAHMADGSVYLTGPLARFALNAERLTPRAAALVGEIGLEVPCRNPFRSIIVRAIETLVACEEALRIVDGYEPPEHPAVDVTPRAGVGHGATEAPRGILYHRYEIDDDGKILTARIVPPTAQNQPAIEYDLATVAAANLHLSDLDLQWLCEQTIRNYDPCISCATHFLKLEMDRR
jgi:sulfhydrogenase subunit alpha